jgi:cell fate (sporulation/competence/biofilm development) regulator YlbF (YheA/YmcA/DUF963 family)
MMEKSEIFYNLYKYRLKLLHAIYQLEKLGYPKYRQEQLQMAAYEKAHKKFKKFMESKQEQHND